MEGERKLKKLLIRIATLSCIIVICFSSVAGCSKKNEEESENILSNKYYMGAVDFSVQVIKFNDDYVVEWIDCGFGRSEDKRTKYYGTYEIDGRGLKITLSGQSEKVCVIHNEGETITIDGEEFDLCDIETLSEETQKKFD